MAFLDNSGDIILDAVLTDTGRKRLARGDGSFRITKFCLHDDEINYALYNKSHASGSAYYDLEILQTPILEAFTNNTSGMKYKLLSISRTNLLYLPIMELRTSVTSGANDVFNAMNNAVFPGTTDNGSGHVSTALHIIAVDEDTVNLMGAQTTYTSNQLGVGVIDGVTPSYCSNIIEIHQGIDNTAKSSTVKIDPSLEETQYIIEMDNRLGTLVDLNNNAVAPTFIDDDNIASYFVTTVNPNLVKTLQAKSGNQYGTGYTPIAGARGSALGFKIASSIEVRDSTYLFGLIGTGGNAPGGDPPKIKQTSPSVIDGEIMYIDSIVRVSGATLGYSIDIPVRYVKKR